MTHAQLAEELTQIARLAGDEIMKVYAGDFTAARKADKSPVTAADVAAEAVIVAALRRLTPDIPVVAEEEAHAHGLPEHAPERFWLVDPLDGTKEFVARNGEFTVNIALVDGTKPVLGIVYLPALNEIYRGHSGIAERSFNGSAFERVAARDLPAEGATMTISRSHAADERVKAEALGEHVNDTIVAGSSLKFCRLAEGVADLYPRFGTTMEWDTAAGHAVLAAAGGSVATVEGGPLTYGKPGFRNPHFIARGRRG
ncbi:3'(2'),5'-bisphosphate nucleotidase CysQ [Dongia deserti]|uniref:3'(2'),5'-bisphosphate nucleotidase CysQ n=1 Tax=Dongia deserti TaxID=2268030 RepID=UPI000E648025|nr:3'(2'),5'-bisphosphate nucleotidase CysQ [Dongia deserti]